MTGPLRERDGARELLAAETERARAGSGGLVLLQGATGTGRTSVLEDAVRDAAGRGLRVLRTRCSPEDSGVPFATVLQLLAPVPDFTDLVPDPDDRGSAARLWRLLYAYAAEGPLLLAVDDVHLADAPSLRWLREAVRRIDRLPVLLVASERSQYDIDPRGAGLAQSLPPSLVRTHTIAPLGDTAAAELVRAAFPAAGPEWTAECVRAGTGNPMLLHALLDDLGGPRPAGPVAADAAPPLPDTCAALYPGSYPAAVSWWLNSAGAATADVARCLAALEEAWPQESEGTQEVQEAQETQEAEETSETAGAQGTREAPQQWTGGGTADPVGPDVAGTLAEAAGADPARVTGWLTAMTRIGLLRPDSAGRPRFAHRLLRDAVLTGWPTARRGAAHLVAAEAILRRGERVEAVAAHLLRAPGVGLPWALRVLRDAATVAVHDARPGAAARYLRRALDEPLSDGRRQQLLTELGSLEYASADGAVGIARLAEAQHLHAAPATGCARPSPSAPPWSAAARSPPRWRCCGARRAAWTDIRDSPAPCGPPPPCCPTPTSPPVRRPTAGFPRAAGTRRNSSAPPAGPCWCGTRPRPA